MIFFLHIPKTAGTSLTTVLKIQYKKREIYPWDNIHFHKKIDEFKNLEYSDPKKAEAKVLKGHFPFGLHNYVSGDHKYVTFVRDPNKRLISHLIQFMRMPNSAVAKDFESGTSVVDLLLKYPYFRNAQATWISGLNGVSVTEEVKYERAIENIEKHFAFVGLTERFDESLLLLSKILKWQFPPLYSNLNVSKIREKDRLKLDDHTLEVINELNLIDQKLYDYCTHRFNWLIERKRINLSIYRKQLFLFQKAHKIYLKSKQILGR